MQIERTSAVRSSHNAQVADSLYETCVTLPGRAAPVAISTDEFRDRMIKR
jgi:hypothetical protein